ncbi:UNKNOWN [Stylonychia lemnae]|uniref:Uncharacterized protein n=1 Tax=Stylonychia lemnae TaxID=5949 RepID=A0A078ATG0_STYLE|nr:UNKNOWN [Stylonychia lemnae]|eukprot:CDW84153.1 UNKNOWN [Stylonychia lemnae]
MKAHQHFSNPLSNQKQGMQTDTDFKADQKQRGTQRPKSSDKTAARAGIGNKISDKPTGLSTMNNDNNNQQNANQMAEEYKERMQEKLKSRIIMDTRFQKIKQDAQIDVEVEFQKNFKDYDLIVDTASNLFLQDKQTSKISQNRQQESTMRVDQVAAEIQKQAAALMLPPLVKLVDEQEYDKEELDPKHVLRNRALKDKNLDLYGQIDKFKREAAHMYVQMDQESEIDRKSHAGEDEDEDLLGDQYGRNGAKKQESQSMISNEFWDEIKSSPSMQGKTNTSRIKPQQLERDNMMKQNFDDVVHNFQFQKNQVMDHRSREIGQLRAQSLGVGSQDDRLNSSYGRNRTPGRMNMVSSNQLNMDEAVLPIMTTKEAMMKQNILYTEAEVQSIRNENARQVRLVKKAAEVQMRNIKMLAKEKARDMLEKTVRRINEQFQHEIVALLLDYSNIREQLTKNERDTRVMRKRITEQEVDITQRNQRMLASGLLESNKELELMELEEPKDESLQPLSQKLESYYDKKQKNPTTYKESYFVEKNCPKHLNNAFNFYGGFVQLNLKEKAQVVESEIVVYYKQTLIELEQKNKVLESEVKLLKQLNLDYYKEANEQEQHIKDLDQKILDQVEDQNALIAKYELRIKQMFEDFFSEKSKMEEEALKEKTILQEELRLNDIIKEQLQQGQDKLRQELKELKRIIKIPRMHFKYLEKLEYDEILNQMKEIEEKQVTHPSSSNLMSNRKKILKKHIRNLSMTSKDMQKPIDSMTSFFTTPIQNQISQKHQVGINAIIIPSAQHQSNDLVGLANQQLDNSYGKMHNMNSNKQQQFTNLTLNKRDSLSSRSDLRKRAGAGEMMSHTQVGFQHFNNMVGMKAGLENNHVIFSKENKLKQRLGNLTSLSPRSQTAISMKPSNKNIRTPSTQRVSGLVPTDNQISAGNSNNPVSAALNSNYQSYRQHSQVLMGENEAAVQQLMSKETAKMSSPHQQNLMFQHQTSNNPNSSTKNPHHLDYVGSRDSDSHFNNTGHNFVGMQVQNRNGGDKRLSMVTSNKYDSITFVQKKKTNNLITAGDTMSSKGGGTRQ